MEYIIGIPYVNRLDLLLRAVYSVQAHWRHVVIIDNSEAGELRAEPSIPGAIEIYQPPVPLTFTQSMNLLQYIAMGRNCPVFFFMHSDAQVLSDTFEKLLFQIQGWQDTGRRWGCAFTNYDALAAFHTDAIREVGRWDTIFPQYFADCDYYRRLRLAGFEEIQTGLAVHHEESATRRSNPYYDFLNSITFPLYEQYYVRKWGGRPGEEQFHTPFG